MISRRVRSFIVKQAGTGLMQIVSWKNLSPLAPDLTDHFVRCQACQESAVRQRA